MTSRALPALLVVDDDEVFRGVLVRELRAAGYRVDAVARGDEVETAILAATYDVALLDLKMPGRDGIATLQAIKAARPLLEVVILTGHGSVEAAVQALKLGAFDFLAKPCDLDHLESVIQRAAEKRTLRSENEALRLSLARGDWAAEPLGRSPAMEQVRALAAKVAPTASTVLLRGETGTGKEVIARTIHRMSPRRDRPFVVVDCGATEDTLALSELFGHERGAFTGAAHRRHGLFELADLGTVLIDEVGDASPAVQASLLRVLEAGTIRRVGGDTPIRVDVRILAATHRDLEGRVRDGSFREDLYHRLNVFAIAVPPLRQHSEDILELVEHFLAALCPAGAPAVAPEARALLEHYHWPGNVRELRNVLERAVILAGGGAIGPEHLPPGFAAPPARLELGSDDAPLSLREIEGRYLLSLLERFDGHHGRTAAALGISERTLYRKLGAARRRKGLAN